MIPPFSSGSGPASMPEERPRVQRARQAPDAGNTPPATTGAPDSAQAVADLAAIFDRARISDLCSTDQAPLANAAILQRTEAPDDDSPIAEQIPKPRNTRAIVADIERRGMIAVIQDIQTRCSEICEPRRMLDTRGALDAKPLLGPVSAALTLDRYVEKYPDLTIVPTSKHLPHGTTPENLDRIETALGDGRPVFLALEFCISHTQLVGLFPREDLGEGVVQAFNFDSIGGPANEGAISAVLEGLPSPQNLVIDSHNFPRQFNVAGCRTEGLVFAKDFHLMLKNGPEEMKDMARVHNAMSERGRLPQATLRVGERRDFLRKQSYQENAPYRFQNGEPGPGKTLGRHRKDHTAQSKEYLFHHAKTLSYVEHALRRLHNKSRAEGATMAEVAEASLARHFGPSSRVHSEALLTPPGPMRRVQAHADMAALVRNQQEASRGHQPDR